MTAGAIFIGAELLMRLLFLLAFKVPFLYRLGFLLLRPFSSLLDVLALPVYPAWPVNLVGWMAASYYVIRRRSRGEPLNPMSPETTQKIVGRVRMFLGHLAVCLGCLLVGGLLISATVLLLPPSAFGGARGWEAFGMALAGEAELGLFGATARVVAIVLAVIAAFTAWYALWLMFAGREIDMDYLCPHCGHSFDLEPLPDPPAVFRCPECGRTVRRDAW